MTNPHEAAVRAQIVASFREQAEQSFSDARYYAGLNRRDLADVILRREARGLAYQLAAKLLLAHKD